jgi:hypothetical protein
MVHHGNPSRIVLVVLVPYVVGTWIYGGWYIWEHWAGYWGYGNLAWYAFIRAIVWPVWVLLALN